MIFDSGGHMGIWGETLAGAVGKRARWAASCMQSLRDGLLTVVVVGMLWAAGTGVAQADVTGTLVQITVGGSATGIENIPVGTQIDLAGGSGKWIDINPATKTITLTALYDTEWGVPQFEVVFSGGNLGSITGITRTGGSAANVTSYSASASGKTITFILPPSPENDNGTITFTFTSTANTPAPTISGIAPSSGTAAGGTAVTVSGANFTGLTALTIGGVSATSITVINSTTITATTPAHAAGTASVLATTPAGTNAANTLYTYFSVPNAPTVGTATPGNSQASVTFAPNGTGGSPITGYTVTSNPDSISQTGTSSPITVSGLTNGTAYTFTVVATNAAGDSVPSAASNSATPKANQVITFTNPGAQNFGTSPTLVATSTSSLTPTFTSSTTGVCTISSWGMLTFVTAGSCTIDADQAGNNAFNAASTVSRTFTVNAVVPGAPTIGTASADDTQASVTFTAPASNGGSAITNYTVTSSPPGASGSSTSSPIIAVGLTNGTPYTFTVAAENSAGTGSPSSASNSVTPTAPQTITFANPGAQNFGTSPTVTATATSGLPVVFTSSTTGVCTINSSGMLTFLSAGSCTIAANQSGNAGYLAANQVSQSFTVMAVAPGQPDAPIATAGDTQASVEFAAPAVTGGSAITSFTVTPNPADVSPVNGASSPIVVLGLTNGQAYTFTVTASNSVGPSVSSPASNSVVPSAWQTITFINPGTLYFGTTPTLTATSDSGLTPTFTSTTTSVCTISNLGALSFVAAGTCTIHANQAGNGSYLPATQVTRTFSVLPVVPGAPTGAVAVAGPNSAEVSFVAPVFGGGDAISSYRVTANPGGVFADGPSSPITVPGLDNGTAYTFTVTANNGAGPGTPSAPSGAVTPQGTQTISFANPGAQDFGTTPTLVATATSALPVTFSSSTAGVCTITSGGLLTTVSPGTCTILADQAGNGMVLPATQVSQSFAVEAVVPGIPTGVSANGGPSMASVAFTAPSFGGGSPVTGYTVTASPGGATGTGTSSPISVMGLDNGTAYTFTVAAINAVGSGLESVASAAIVPGTVQTLALTNPGNQMLSARPTLSATATSGLPATFISTTPAVCAITAAGALTPQALGTCTVVASQPGDATYQPAPAATESFAIVADVIALTPGAGALPTAIAGIAYDQVFTATGGTAPYAYTVTAGALPGDLTLTGASLSGTPTAIGSFAFTVTATDDNGFMASAAYTLEIGAPTITLTPGAGALPKGKAGVVYSLAFAVAGGAAPHSLAITAGSLPSGLGLSGTSLTGTPTSSGASTFTVTVTDGNGFATSAVYTLEIDSAASITLIPSSGALPAAMVGEVYSSTIAANGHPGPFTYVLTSGAFPDGMTLNRTTGELTGLLNPGAQGNYAFTITVSSGDGASTDGNYTLAVGARSVTAADQEVIVPPGSTPVPVDLTVGGTGGPFTSANIVGVEPQYAGTASLVGAETARAGAQLATNAVNRLHLVFIPNPQFAGKAIVTFTLTSALGTSKPATVSYAMEIDQVGVEKMFGELSDGFVSTRAGLLAGAVSTPGLAERRNAASASTPGTIRISPSGDSVTMNFAASTLAATAAGAAAQSLAMEPVEDNAVNFWIDGTATLHIRADGSTDHWGSMALLSTGADMLVNDQLLVGVALHADWMDDITSTSRVVGQGILAGPYVSAELGKGVFLDASLFYGRSWNEISTDLFRGTFETDRFLAKMQLEGEWTLSEDLALRPSANVSYLHEAAGAYTVSDGAGTIVAVDGFTLSQLRLSAGAVLQYKLDLEAFVVRPFIGGELGLSLDGTSQKIFSNVSGGFDITGDGNWTLGVGTKASFEGSEFRALSATGRFGVNF